MDLLSKIMIVESEMVHLEELESTKKGKTEGSSIAWHTE